jgi:glycerol-3-phosphate acyltransferase PlsY
MGALPKLGAALFCARRSALATVGKQVTLYLLTAGLSYLSGSIPFGYLLCASSVERSERSAAKHRATNVSQIAVLGILTLLLDALKGFVPVMLTLWWAHHGVHGTSMLAANHEQTEAARTLAHPFIQHTYLLASIAAFFAIVGHVFPVWLHFRGGKGVATGLGSWVGIAPRGVLVMVVVFILMVLVLRYISLSSITAAAIFPRQCESCMTITTHLRAVADGSPSLPPSTSCQYPATLPGYGSAVWYRTQMSEIAIIGAGAWGTALSIVADATVRIAPACGHTKRGSSIRKCPSGQ